MKRRILILWIAGLWATTVAAAAVLVPLDMTSGRPVVEIEVNGGTQLTMILDTGAGRSVVNADVARKLDLEILGERLIGDPSGRNQHFAKQVALTDVRIAGVPLGNLEAAALDLPQALGHHRRPFDGVLSLKDLEKYLVTLDLAAGQMHLTQGELDETNIGVIPFHIGEAGIPWIQVLVGPLTVKAFLDTGNPGQLSLARSISKHLDLHGPLKVVGEGRTVSSTFEILAAPLNGSIKFAGHTINNPTLSFDDLHRGTQANIGSGLLSQYVVTLDQRNKLIRFESVNTVEPNRIAFAHPGH